MSTIVVTGANRGIGLGLVKAYAGAGDSVFALCRDPAGADALNAVAAASGGKVTVLEGDVADDASIARAAAAIGDRPVDVLVNNAGIFRVDKAPPQTEFEGWRESFEVMTIGPFRVAQALLPNIEKARGKIMTVTSQIGASVYPGGGYYSYGAAKSGVNRVMQMLAHDLKDKGVSVAVVHPGYVSSDMGGPNAPVSPDESAAGIRAVIATMVPTDAGAFYKWDGGRHDW